MSTLNADNFLKIICPNCKTYIKYSKEEFRKSIKEKVLICKLSNKSIPLKQNIVNNFFKNYLKYFLASFLLYIYIYYIM